MVAYHGVLQELTPNLVIVQNIERFPDVAVDAHIVYLVYRIETEQGFTICVRSLICPDLMKAMDEPTDVWPSNLTWLHGERHDDTAFTFHIGASLRANDVDYANQWMFEALGCALRSERIATNRQWITSEF